MGDPVSGARELAQRLVAHEALGGQPPSRSGQPAGRVCELLRGSLSRVVGVAGYRALVVRALALAQRDAPALAGVEVKPDGTLAGFAELPDQNGEAAAHAGLVLVTQVLALLYLFIGERLTLRLVRDV